MDFPEQAMSSKANLIDPGYSLCTHHAKGPDDRAFCIQGGWDQKCIQPCV